MTTSDDGINKAHDDVDAVLTVMTTSGTSAHAD